MMKKLELELLHYELTQYRDNLLRMTAFVELSEDGHRWMDREMPVLNGELAWMERKISQQKARRQGRTLEQKFMKFVTSIVPRKSRKSNV